MYFEKNPTHTMFKHAQYLSFEKIINVQKKFINI
jgi:hypothetical protein